MNPSPPNSPEAEAALLGIVLAASPEVLPTLAELVVDDFFLPMHRCVWKAIRAVEMAGEKAGVGATMVNPITVWEAMRAENDHGRVEGGVSGLFALATAAPLPAQANHYAKIVKDRSALRRIIEFAMELQMAAYGGRDEATAIIGRAWEGIGKLEATSILDEPKLVGDVLGQVVEVIEQRQKLGTKGDVMTGHDSFDRIIGGFRRQEFIVVSAAPGMGKSAYGLGVAKHAAIKQEIPVLIFSAEMAIQELVERMIASEARTPLDDIGNGRAWHDFHRGASRLVKAPIWIEDRPMSIEQLLGIANRWFARHVAKPGVANPIAFVLVDYIQIIEVAAKVERREREVGIISRSLKMLAKRMDSPVMAISSLNREGQKTGNVPTVNSLRDSGAVEYDADKILFVHREFDPNDVESRNASGPGKLITAKNRGGQVGIIDLLWEGPWTTFRGIETRYGDGEQQQPEREREYHHPHWSDDDAR